MNVFRAKKTREAEPVGDVQDSLTLDLRAPTPPLEIASHGISGGMVLSGTWETTKSLVRMRG